MMCGVVVLEGKAEVADGIVEQAGIAVVATEKVGGEEDALRRQPGALGVRPVQIRGIEEFQLAIAEIGAVAGADETIRPSRFCRIEQPLEHQAGLRRDVAVSRRARAAAIPARRRNGRARGD
jgi:hypothetical protein